jgi:hypothetical protein
MEPCRSLSSIIAIFVCLVSCRVIICQIGPQLNQNVNQTIEEEDDSVSPGSKIVFMAPKDAEKVYSLNYLTERLFENIVRKGWTVEANQETSFVIYLLMSPEQTSFPNSKTIIRKRLSRFNASQIDNSTFEFEKHIYYVYFTQNPYSCSDYLNYQHIPLIINEPIHLESNITKPILVKTQLNFSLKHVPDSCYYICLSRAGYELIDSIDPDNFLFFHQGQDSMFTFMTEFSEMSTWSKYVIYSILVCFNSILNGLNIGLMALSVEELELLIKTSDSAKERRYASNILPLRRKGNYLLCSILLSITLTGSVSVLVLDNILEGLLAGNLLFERIFSLKIIKSISN